MCIYSHRFFRTTIIAAPLLLWFFGCNTIDHSMNTPKESKMAKSSKKAEPVRIMCLGNSFTWGRHGDGSKSSGYRKELYNKLILDGKNDDNPKKYEPVFVGSQNDKKESKYSKHEGYDGIWIHNLADKIDNLLNKNKPDIILLHIGHNPTPTPDIWDWEDRAKYLVAIINKIDAWEDANNKTVHLILAKVVSMTKKNGKKTKYTKKPPFNYQGLEVYNDLIEELYKEYKEGNSLYLVDMSDKWDRPTYKYWEDEENWRDEDNWKLKDEDITVEKGIDGVHPTNKGFSQMATIWFDKISTIITLNNFPEKYEKDKNQSPVKSRGGGTTEINIEAEDKKYCSWIRGSFVENNHYGYTGKGFVNTPNHTRAWMQCEVKVKTAGSYRIEVRYANGSSGRAAQLIVNGKAKATGAFASTGNWGKWDDEIFTNIPLRAGTNTIRLSANTGGGLGNIDHFSYDVSGEGEEQYEKRGPKTQINIEAEDDACSWIRGSSVDNNHRGFKGKGFVNTPNHTGAWMQCDVKVKAAGSYRIEVRYANGSSGRPAQLIVNGKAKVTGAFASTGNWGKWNDEIFKNIPLKAGTNKVRLSAKTSGGLGNIDYFDFSR